MSRSLNLDVQAYLKENKIKKKALAEHLNVSPSLLSHWFSGRVTFPQHILDKIVEFMQK